MKSIVLGVLLSLISFSSVVNAHGVIGYYQGRPYTQIVECTCNQTMLVGTTLYVVVPRQYPREYSYHYTQNYPQYNQQYHHQHYYHYYPQYPQYNHYNHHYVDSYIRFRSHGVTRNGTQYQFSITLGN